MKCALYAQVIMYVPRVYPQAIAGKLNLMQDNGLGTNKGKFTLIWDHQNNLGSTDIFVPPSVAKNLRIQVIPADVGCEYNPDTYLLGCTYPHDGKISLTLY